LSSIKYRDDIQALRGLSILAVLLFHANEEIFPNGYLGVDIFFCISGFVVTPLILRIFKKQKVAGGVSDKSNFKFERFKNLKYFYKRRFYRLMPALAISLGFSILVITLLGNPSDHQRFARQGLATLFLLGNIGAYRYSGDYFSSAPNPLVHTWSLSVEEQIFIFLPIVLICIFLNREVSKLKFAWTLVIISFCSFILFLNPTALQTIYFKIGSNYSDLAFNFYSPIERIWQFTIGGLSYLYVSSSRINLRKTPKWLSQILVLGLALIIFLNFPIEIYVGSMLTSFFAVVIVVCSSMKIVHSSIYRKLIWLGDRSYSIYLLHMPLLYVAKYSTATKLSQVDNRTVQVIIALSLSIILGSISYSKIENRYRNRGDSIKLNFATAAKLTIFCILAPASLFLALDHGTGNRYWGLDGTLKQPKAVWLSDPNCNQMSYRNEPCIYGNNVLGKTVLLIGDSHAAHISQALISVGKRSDWNVAVWTQSGCQVRFQQKLKNQLTEMCINQNLEILKWVRDLKPEALIISQYVYSDSNLKDLKDAMLKLKIIVPKILLVENNPIFPDAEEFMVSRPLIMAPYSPAKSFEESKMDLRGKEKSDEMARWAKMNNISTLNVRTLFCEKGICTRYENGQWLYRDADHFSVAGADKTIPSLSIFLNN